MWCEQLFTRPAARALYSNQRLQRWCFDVELIFLAQRLGIPIVETSVNWTEIPGVLLLNGTHNSLCVCVTSGKDSPWLSKGTCVDLRI